MYENADNDLTDAAMKRSTILLFCSFVGLVDTKESS